MFNGIQVTAMIELQAAADLRSDCDGRHERRMFLRDALFEMTDAMQHSGWCLNRDFLGNAEAATNDIINAFQHILSEFIAKARGDTVNAATLFKYSASASSGDVLFDGQSYTISMLDPLRAIEINIGLCAVGRICIPLFARLFTDLGLQWADLYERFVAKKVLQCFRNDQGYPNGRYVRVWSGQEDSSHLKGVMRDLDRSSPQLYRHAYEGLDVLYDSLIRSRGAN